MLYGREMWCLTENEKEVLRKTERAMVRAISGGKVADKKTIEKQIAVLGLKKLQIDWEKQECVATSMLQTTKQKSPTAVLTYKPNGIYESSYHDRRD